MTDAVTRAPHRPAFITFTGVDQFTNIDGMIRLQDRYPIEWGVLFSHQRQGVGRYPPFPFIRQLAEHGAGSARARLTLSAHICGEYAKSLLLTGGTALSRHFTSSFGRAQINVINSEHVDTGLLFDWGHGQGRGMKPILQCRGPSFPEDRMVSWLFDQSGGTGQTPSEWPASPDDDTIRGYAGGLNPDNVAFAVDTIGQRASRYWIDMETGVRDEDDRFSLDKCRAVCEVVYPDY